MSDAPTRRSVVTGLTVASTGALEVLAFVRPARASVTDRARIDAAAREVQANTQVFDAAISQLEASLPVPNRCLIYRRGGRLPYSLCSMERRFDGVSVYRGLDLHGNPGSRFIASPYLIEAEIAQPTLYGRRGWRRYLRQTLKRARRYRAMVRRAEDPAIDAEEPMMKARRRLEELAAEIFAKPSTTQEDIAVKARALVAFSAIDEQTWRRCQAGSWGSQLAGELLALPGRTS